MKKNFQGERSHVFQKGKNGVGGCSLANLATIEKCMAFKDMRRLRFSLRLSSTLIAEYAIDVVTNYFMICYNAQLDNFCITD